MQVILVQMLPGSKDLKAMMQRKEHSNGVLTCSPPKRKRKTSHNQNATCLVHGVSVIGINEGILRFALLCFENHVCDTELWQSGHVIVMLSYGNQVM